MTDTNPVFSRILKTCIARRLLRKGERVVVLGATDIGSLGAIAFCAHAAATLGLADVQVLVRHDSTDDSVEDAADVARFARMVLLSVQVIDRDEPTDFRDVVVVTGETVEVAARRVLGEILTPNAAIRGLKARRRDRRVRPLLQCTEFDVDQMLCAMNLTAIGQSAPRALAQNDERLHTLTRVIQSYVAQAEQLIADVPQRIRANRSNR